MTLQDCLDKLKSEEPTPALAWEIALALGAVPKEFDVGDGDAEGWLEWPDGSRVRDFLYSLDDAYKLAERFLPEGGCWNVSSADVRHGYIAQVAPGYGLWASPVTHKSPTVALVTALMKHMVLVETEKS